MVGGFGAYFSYIILYLLTCVPLVCVCGVLLEATVANKKRSVRHRQCESERDTIRREENKNGNKFTANTSVHAMPTRPLGVAKSPNELVISNKATKRQQQNNGPTQRPTKKKPN